MFFYSFRNFLAIALLLFAVPLVACSDPNGSARRAEWAKEVAPVCKGGDPKLRACILLVEYEHKSGRIDSMLVVAVLEGEILHRLSALDYFYSGTIPLTVSPEKVKGVFLVATPGEPEALKKFLEDRVGLYKSS